MKKVSLLLCMICTLYFHSNADAQKSRRGTEAEAITMVKKVQETFKLKGERETFKLVTGKAFNYLDLYPFIYTLEAVGVAHGYKKELVGKSLYNFKSITGKLLLQEMIAVVKSRKRGWVDYKWPNPVNGKIASKRAYVEQLGKDYIVAVGVHKSQ